MISPQFKQNVEAIVEAFGNLKNDLDKERRAMMRLWKKREKQIFLGVCSLAGVYGDMQGILGALPEIKSLELPSGSDTTEEEE